MTEADGPGFREAVLPLDPNSLPRVVRQRCPGIRRAEFTGEDLEHWIRPSGAHCSGHQLK